MKITTQGNGIRIGERLEGKITDKMRKFDKYFGDEGSFNVRIRPEGSQMVVEITMKLDKLESQIRRQKTKFLKKKKEYPQIANYLEEDNGSDFDYIADAPEESKITRRKTFELRPMTSEDAILQMEMLGHDFLVYLDADTDSVCVVYKRNDGDYGLLEPKY